MPQQPHNSNRVAVALRSLIAVLLLAATLVSISAETRPAEAQETELERLQFWGQGKGILDDSKIWKYRQSVEGDDLGSAAAADPDLDDSAWTEINARWREFPGPNVANHFRKDFTLSEYGVDPAQVVAMQIGFQYDDSAVLYLNGVEVYRSIRGNLDATYSVYPESSDIPHDALIEYGGCERCYIQIPDLQQLNDCEEFPGCTRSPYGSPHPPEIPLDLLNLNGVNTWAATTWNQSGGGSGDSSFNHTFELLLDRGAPPGDSIVINEVQASNDTTWAPDLDYPDWFELYNASDQDISLFGWTVEDDSEPATNTNEPVVPWTFPDVTIPAGGYLLVAANDVEFPAIPVLQADFKISKEGDRLVLTSPSGFIADSYQQIPRQQTDGSYGRPAGGGDPTYLAAPTPGGPNTAAGDRFVPVIRPFDNRMYNVDEAVRHQIDAFDPDADALSYALNPLPPGLTVSSEGLITGSFSSPGTYVSEVVVTDTDGDQAKDQVIWLVLQEAVGPAPLVLNEYNAVPADEELRGGSELGNGGDWYEFIVIEDNLDLRGYQIELYDKKGANDDLRQAAVVTFGDDPRIARAPAGTIITISQNFPDDLRFNGEGDWHINFQIQPDASGAYFAAPTSPNFKFNSTRTAQTVLIKNSDGLIVTPLSGETEAWDSANGNVSGSEVMSLCVQPEPNMTLDPVNDYRDNGRVSTFGQRNICVFPDPLDPANEITFEQRLGPLRRTATFGAGSGDVNCDLELTLSDAMVTAQYTVGARVDTGPCFFDLGGADQSIYAGAADVTADGVVELSDAVGIARCTVGIDLPWC